MTITEIKTAKTGEKITIKKVSYIIVQASKKILWVKRENGKQIYRTAYFVRDGKIFANGLPR